MARKRQHPKRHRIKFRDTPKINRTAWNFKRTTMRQAESMLVDRTIKAVMRVAKKYSWGGHEATAARKYVIALVECYGPRLEDATKAAEVILRPIQVETVRKRFALTCTVLQMELEDEIEIQVPGMNEPWFRTMRADAQRFIGRSRRAA